MPKAKIGEEELTLRQIKSRLKKMLPEPQNGKRTRTPKKLRILCSTNWQDAVPTHVDGAALELTCLEQELIRWALRRVEERRFGECESCGEIINPKRLKAILYVPFCQDCQEEIDTGIHESQEFLGMFRTGVGRFLDTVHPLA